MDNPLDQTTLTTVSLLESRLLRIEHLLYGHGSTTPPTSHDSVLRRITALERRFTKMLSDVRVYAELMKIYKSSPDLFRSPPPSTPPSQLSPSTIRSIVIASAPSFPATLSALTAIKDVPVPDPAASASLVSLADRMRALEAVQLGQAAELANLRARSETLVRSWYEDAVCCASEVLADTSGRLQRVERELRRRERQIAEEKL